jgi:hypothetical protein
VTTGKQANVVMVHLMFNEELPLAALALIIDLNVMPLFF